MLIILQGLPRKTTMEEKRKPRSTEGQFKAKKCSKEELAKKE